MKTETNILLVDKGGSFLDELKNACGEEYSVLSAWDENECLAIAREQPLLLIFLNADEEGDNALTTCNKLKVDAQTKDIPIVVISEQNGLDEKILSYDAGAYDFIIKPCMPHEWLVRINLVQKRREIECQLADEARVASETALSAMTGNSELGQAIRFVERSYDAQSYQELAQQLLSVTDNLGLNCCLYFNSYLGDLFFNLADEVSPLEKKLMTSVYQSNSRFTDYGKRTFICFSRVAMLVKNMPLDEPERYGRYKDLFPAMLGAADSKTKALDIEQALIKQTKDLSISFRQVKDTLENLSKAFAQNQQKTMDIMREMLRELDFELPSMGLENDQEEYLVNRIDQGIVEAEVIMDQTENLNAAFHNISALLAVLVEQQEKITEDVRSSSSAIKDKGEDLDGMADVELF